MYPLCLGPLAQRFRSLSANPTVFWVCLLALLGAPAAAPAASVTLGFDALALTIVNTPFGLEIPRETMVSGFFSYEDTTGDVNVSSSRGDYPHSDGGAFFIDILGTEITGSGIPYVPVENFDGPIRFVTSMDPAPSVSRGA